MPPPQPLYKHKSWSPDILRDEEWLKKKNKQQRRRNKSVTDEDIDELKACVELGFGFDESNSKTLPALNLYYAVNYYKQYHNDTISKSSSMSSFTSSSSDLSSPLHNPHAVFGPGVKPETMKTRLRQWAQVVGVSLRQSSSSPLSFP
uniref:uncharacterized protein LOC122579799 n=1 Tax=Erigeron canadensis TaxID=72917 RepID=UPI001CB926A0|nr:uncharacterized protein LOC122579799 [Erigeron canadensis]